MLWLWLVGLVFALAAAAAVCGGRPAAAGFGAVEAAAGAAGPGVAVVLVHGTFAPDAPWTRKDGALARAALAIAPAVTLYRFQWSGANSHAARRRAGRELAGFLRERHAADGHRDFRLVAHSHGGNVALYAMADPAARALVRQLAFLGTPFLAVGRWPLRGFARATAAILAPAPLLLLGLLAMTLDLRRIPPEWLAVLVVTGGVGCYFAGKWLLDRGSGVVLAWLRRKRLAFAAVIRLRSPCLPCFIAVVEGDEPARYLASLERLASLPIRLVPIARAAAAGALLTLLGGRIVGGIAGYRGFVTADPLVLAPIAALIAAPFWLPAVAAAVSRWTRGTRAGFGGEPLIAATLRIVPGPLPPWPLPAGSAVYRWRPAAAVKGLRHSGLYGAPAVIEALCVWLSRGPAATPPPPRPQPAIGSPVRDFLRLPGWFALGALAMVGAVLLADSRRQQRADDARGRLERCIRETEARSPNLPPSLRRPAAQVECNNRQAAARHAWE